MRPPSPISFAAARIAVMTPWTLTALLAGQCRGVGVGIIDRAADGNAGIVDEDVEPAEILGDVLHQLIDIDGGGLVGLVGAGIDALGLQFGDDGFGLVGGGDIADGDIGAFIGEGAGRLAAPMPREPPVTRATLPESFLVIGFLRCLNSDGHWICRPVWYRNRNY